MSEQGGQERKGFFARWRNHAAKLVSKEELERERHERQRADEELARRVAKVAAQVRVIETARRAALIEEA